VLGWDLGALPAVEIACTHVVSLTAGSQKLASSKLVGGPSEPSEKIAPSWTIA
jgi:hypothetical protein